MPPEAAAELPEVEEQGSVPAAPAGAVEPVEAGVAPPEVVLELQEAPEQAEAGAPVPE